MSFRTIHTCDVCKADMQPTAQHRSVLLGSLAFDVCPDCEPKTTIAQLRRIAETRNAEFLKQHGGAQP